MGFSQPIGRNGHQWLIEILEEVNLQDFYSKLTNELQLSKLSHFDFVNEEDLIQMGLSRPASRRLLAAVERRKLFVSNLKNRIFAKLLPSAARHSSSRNEPGIQTNHDPISHANTEVITNVDLGQLSCLINYSDIQIKEDIGNGAHGIVKKGEWTLPNGRSAEVAVKVLRRDILDEPGASFNDFVKEISVMHQLNHPNIIRLYGIVLSSPMMMVTELAPHGNLKDKLRKENGHTSVSLLISYAVQVAAGMSYLESKKFVHRDLAARNLFISGGGRVLIGDLGLMRAIPAEENYYTMNERTKIPYPWCAPESLRSKQFSSASDVYMFGVTLWEMFSFGEEPWANLNLNQILEKIETQDERLPRPEACPTVVFQTLLQCWNTDPCMRPNFPSLYQYLSTSYPLEVRFNQEMSSRGVSFDSKPNQDGLSSPPDRCDDTSSKDQTTDHRNEERKNHKLLDCQLDDRIQVIDGQPEHQWWKGQNQRTYEVGWFPLSSTRWSTPKRGSAYMRKPFKGGYNRPVGSGPSRPLRPIDPHDSKYLKYVGSPIGLTNLRNAGGGLSSCQGRNIGVLERSSNIDGGFLNTSNPFLKQNKTRFRLFKLFGIHSNNGQDAQTINKAYQKFNNEQPDTTRPKTGAIIDASEANSDRTHPVQPVAQQKTNAPIPAATQETDEPLLIDLNVEANSMLPKYYNHINPSNQEPSGLKEQASLIDMEIEFPVFRHHDRIIEDSPLQDLRRHTSETKLDTVDRLSWTGSWNTGTFYESNINIYSAYYCPQDASNENASGGPEKFSQKSRYYSAVAHDESVTSLID